MTVTITDGAVVAGTDNTATTVNLSSLADDTSITSTLALNQDAAGNTFTSVPGNSIALGEGPSISADNIALVTQNSFGVSGEHQGAAVTYADGHIYLSYNNGAAAQQPTDNADIVAFNTASDGATQTFTYAWNYGDFFGIAADGSDIYAAGESCGLTSDDNGTKETKTIFVEFNANGTAGSDPSPAIGYTPDGGSNNPDGFYSYSGVEEFYNVIATVQGGNTILYAVGFGQPNSYSGYVIGEYDSSGAVLHIATDPGSLPGGSEANDAADWNGAIWAVGTTKHGSETYNSPTVWAFSYDLSSVSTYEDHIGVAGSFNGVVTIGNELYAVGYGANGSSQDYYLIAAYNPNGSVAWSETFGPTGTDTLNSAVALDGRLFVVGSTTSGGATEGVLMEINPLNGDVISTQTYDAAQYNAFTSVTTDGHYLYVGGVSGSSSSNDQAVLLTYDVGAAVTTAEDTAIGINSLSVSDAATGAAQIEVTFSVGHGSLALNSSAGLDSTVGSGTGSLELVGSQAAIDAALAQGVIYDPTANYTGTDTLAIVTNDEGHNGSGVAFSTTQDVGITVNPADFDRRRCDRHHQCTFGRDCYLRRGYWYARASKPFDLYRRNRRDFGKRRPGSQGL